MRPLNLTAKLKDTANASAPELSFQRKAVQDYHLRQTKNSQLSQPAESSDRLNNDRDLPSSIFNDHSHAPSSANTTLTPQAAERTFSSITSDSGIEDATAQPEQGMFCLCTSFSAHKQQAIGSSLLGKRRCTSSAVTNLDLEDNDKHIRKKGMN